MPEKYLPIGSVVLLKGGEKTVMITSYCIIPKGQTGATRKDVKIYDYGACLYPEGIIDTNSATAFNHEDIDKIVFTGYESEEHKKFVELINENYDKILAEVDKLGD